MTTTLDISDELRARIEAIAARSSLTASEVLTDALENGHSLAWQEHYLDSVERGIRDADAGNFVSDADLTRVIDKYRSR